MDQMRQHIENKDKAWLVSTLHSAGDAIMTCDSADRLDFANTEALKILGYKLPEILGKPFAEVLKIYRDGQDQAVPLWDHTSPVKLHEKTGLPRHSYYLRPDGSKSYLSAHLSPLLSETGDYLGKVVVFRDISRIIEAEKTIKNERNNLKMMFNLLPTSMLVIDDEMLINRVNQAFLKTFALEERDVIGKAFGDALGCVFSTNGGCGYSLNCSYCQFRKIVTQVLEDKNMVRDQSLKVKFTRGHREESRFLNVSVLPIIIANHAEYIITLEDITEQVYYEKGLKEARESSLSILDSLPVMIYRIDHNHRCDFINQTFKAFMNIARDSFLMDLSGHLKTPDQQRFNSTLKTSLKEKTNFNIELEPLTPEQQDNLRTAKGCVTSLIGIINDILDFAKIEAGKLMINPSSFNLIDAVESTIRTHKKHALEKCLEMTVSYDHIISNFVISDSMRLKQIINNLISNAIKFTNQGSVKIAVSQELLPGKEDEVIVKIAISDTGIGIDEKNYAMLFKSFTQIDGSYTREYGGTGLGLVITRQLLEMMGGSVTFSSQLGVGSTFTIFIPMLFTKKSGETAVDSGEEISFIGSWVLLVEDDRVNQIVIAKMLESLGATVDVAANGAEGVQAAAQKVYDVILMDVQMPVMDGIQATRMIRGWTQSPAPTVNVKVSGLNQKTPIIALTAFALKGDEAIFKASGMDGYLSKPLDRYRMQMLLKEYLGNHENTEVTQMEALISSFYEKDQDLMRSGLTAENTVDEQQKVTVNQKIESLNQLLDQGNLMLMEVIAHQLKGVFEQMNAVELKNLVFKMELEIRKDRVEKVAGYLKRITEIWLLMKADNEWEN